MNAEQKQRIDDMNYKQMLTAWRRGAVGESLFLSDTGKYFHVEMMKKKTALHHSEVVSISKQVGWS
jgi:hypothetical protein